MKLDKDKRYSVAVFTHDRYLYQKIKLELYDIAKTDLCEKATSTQYDVVFTDLDDPDFSGIDGTKISRYESSDAEIFLPFRMGEIKSKLTHEEKKKVELNADTKTVLFGGRKIKLTDMEYALLAVLLESGKEYVSREEIIHKVWNDKADSGVVNVYIHYLREKLESEGEKIILSSRKNGYKLNENFIGE